MALRYIEIKRLLRDRLLAMEPNSRLPSRTALCREYLVTRTTIDHAVSDLMKEGYLYAVNGSGTFVSDVTGNQAHVMNGALNVGVLVPNMLYDTYPGILEGIDSVMQKAGVSVLVCNTDHDMQKQLSCIKRLANLHVDGLILVPAVVSGQVTDLQFYTELSSLTMPLVFCNRGIDGIRAPLICSNNFYGGYCATRCLIDHGYRHIAYLSAVHYRISTERYAGYLSAHWETGRAPEPELIASVEEQSSVELGYRLMRQLLKTRPDVDGVFCFNDQMACGAVNAIVEAGKRVSDDIGVIGYDDTPLCEVLPRHLTSISFCKHEIGRAAAATILKMISGKDEPIEQTTIFCPILHERESCLGPQNRAASVTSSTLAARKNAAPCI